MYVNLLIALYSDYMYVFTTSSVKQKPKGNQTTAKFPTMMILAQTFVCVPKEKSKLAIAGVRDPLGDDLELIKMATRVKIWMLNGELPVLLHFIEVLCKSGDLSVVGRLCEPLSSEFKKRFASPTELGLALRLG